MNNGEHPVPRTRVLFWAVRRELWENRSLYLAPLAVAALFLVGFLLALIRFPARVRAAEALGPAQLQAVIEQPFVIAALLLMAITLIMGVVYSLDALYGERRDRSVLFWKSLPVSDAATVAAKASIPILVLPLVAVGVTVATQVVMLVASSIVLAAAGMGAATVGAHVPIVRVSVTNVVHLVGFHGLWYAPFYGWLLLASAWARRAPLLWAALPPVAIGVVEKVAFNTSYFADLVQHRLFGRMDAGTPASGMTLDMLAPRPLGEFVAGPGLWIGFLLAAAFLLAAVRLYRSRGTV